MLTYEIWTVKWRKQKLELTDDEREFVGLALSAIDDTTNHYNLEENCFDDIKDQHPDQAEKYKDLIKKLERIFELGSGDIITIALSPT